MSVDQAIIDIVQYAVGLIQTTLAGLLIVGIMIFIALWRSERRK